MKKLFYSVVVRRSAGVLALVWGATLLPAAVAQSVSPVISEYHGGPATGSFDVNNDSLSPLVITIEPKSFSIDREGKGEFRALDTGIKVTLSETSMRLPPKSHRTIFYKASAETYPAWFSVYATFRGMPKENHMNVELQLPHTVYLLGYDRVAKAVKGDLMFENLQMIGGTGSGTIIKGTIHNVSAKMLRVDDVNVSEKGRSKETIGGFPLLPGGVHDFAVELNKKNVAVASNEEPAKVVAHYATFSLESVVADKRQ
jgi:hypothetical protein